MHHLGLLPLHLLRGIYAYKSPFYSTTFSSSISGTGRIRLNSFCIFRHFPCPSFFPLHMLIVLAYTVCFIFTSSFYEHSFLLHTALHSRAYLGHNGVNPRPRRHLLFSILFSWSSVRGHPIGSDQLPSGLLRISFTPTP